MVENSVALIYMMLNILELKRCGNTLEGAPNPKPITKNHKWKEVH